MQMSLLASNFLLHFSLSSSPSFPSPHGASDFVTCLPVFLICLMYLCGKWSINVDTCADILDIELGIEPELLGLEYLTSEHIREHFMEAIQILHEAVMMYYYLPPPFTCAK